MVSQIEECCDENPNCRHRAECKKEFDTRCEEWRLNRQRTRKNYRMPTDKERYSTWMPVLNLKEIIRDVSANRIY